MVGVKFFLDTNALMYLAGLENADLQDFKTRIEATNSKLCITHIQMNEWKLQKEKQDYQRKIEEALASLKNKGIAIHDVEPTKGFVLGVGRIGYGALGGEETGKLYDELRKEIGKCEKARGKTKTLLNIARDSSIAVSSLGHDFFITCDRCLSESWKKVIGKHSMLKQRYKFPRVIYTRPIPKAVAKEMLKVIP